MADTMMTHRSSGSIVKRVAEEHQRELLESGDIDENGRLTEQGRTRLEIDDLPPMSDRDLATVRKRIADDVIAEARIAWRTAMKSAAESDIRAAITLCMRAAVAARRALLLEQSEKLETSARQLYAKLGIT
jgi:hypothetical protein